MRKILVIVNPVSGNGKALKIMPDIKSFFNMHSDIIEADFKISRFKDDIKIIASTMYDDGYREFVVVGGDGSLSELVNGLGPKMDNKIKIGVIPYGSGNDFIKSLFSQYQLNDQIKAIIKDQTQLLDLGKVNEHYYINSCTFGIDGPIIRMTDKLKMKIPGEIAYYMSTLKEGIAFKPKIVRLTIDGEVLKGEKILIAFNNGKYIGGGMNITPDADLSDGYLNVCVIDDVSKLKFVRSIKKVYEGQLSDLNEVSLCRIKKGSIEVENGSYDINIDGNLVGKTPATIHIIPNAIRVFKLTCNQ
jgi:YegS/Rv2252/BmrU family lipid kinase